MDLKESIVDFGGLNLQKVQWTFASTMKYCPHFYIVRGGHDFTAFLKTVEYLRKFGVEGFFYKRSGIYLYLGDYWKIWTMGAAIKITTIINIAYRGNTLENRYCKYSELEKNPNVSNIFERNNEQV